ncbi:hypothetical protein GGI12_004532 [Dipsacomyces acuminosporus]|nr:hypothetical protein GGI12_004532 [Dipsacomyces acuminosporus]
MESDREPVRAETPAETENNYSSISSKFEEYLASKLNSIEKLYLIVITDPYRATVFRESDQYFHEPEFEQSLIEKCHTAFGNIKKMHIGQGNLLTLFYGAMAIVHFRAGKFLGTIVCDNRCNIGLIHNLANELRTPIERFYNMAVEEFGEYTSVKSNVEEEEPEETSYAESRYSDDIFNNSHVNYHINYEPNEQIY